jgi:hypothetical protein
MALKSTQKDKLFLEHLDLNNGMYDNKIKNVKKYLNRSLCFI